MLTTLKGDVRAFGMAKEGLIARQFMLGVVQTAGGLPIYHEVFAGNAAETTTLLPTLATVLERFPEVRRLVLVADRGLLSLDNLEALEAVRLANGAPLEFIIAVPGRRCHEFAELLGPFQRAHCAQATEEVTGKLAWQARRLIVAHDPAAAALQTARRSEQIAALIAQGEAWAGKLVEQDDGVKHRGRKLSDSGAKARFYLAVCEAHLSRIIRVDLKAQLFSYEIDETARGLAELMDGKLLLVTAGSRPRRGRRALQGTRRHRARLQGAEIRDRDRAGLSPAARAHPRARLDLLHGAHPAPGHARAPSCGAHPSHPRERARAAASHPASPHPARRL